jgi:predicted ArsR family transcriptional regulator
VSANSEVAQEIDSLLEELVREHHLDERQPGDVSAKDLSKATGLTERRCNQILKEKVEKGEVVVVKIRVSSGQPTQVYRKVKVEKC